MSSLDSSVCFKCDKEKPVVHKVRAKFTKDGMEYWMIVWMCSSCIEEINKGEKSNE